jgi:hypothetical protein
VAPAISAPPFEVARQDLTSQARLAWLPIGFGDGILVDEAFGWAPQHSNLAAIITDA